MHTFLRRAALAATPLALLAAVAVTPGTALACSNPATVHITGQATLLSGGSVALRVDYTCPPNFGGPHREPPSLGAAVRRPRLQ